MEHDTSESGSKQWLRVRRDAGSTLRIALQRGRLHLGALDPVPFLSSLDHVITTCTKAKYCTPYCTYLTISSIIFSLISSTMAYTSYSQSVVSTCQHYICCQSNHGRPHRSLKRGSSRWGVGNAVTPPLCLSCTCNPAKTFLMSAPLAPS